MPTPLSKLILVDKTKIETQLTQLQFSKPYELHCLAEVDSTNRFLNDLTTHQPTVFCCAEQQTAGRGRLGRTWNSPFGDNIYFSCAQIYQGSLSDFSGLSLVIALAILHSLKQSGFDQKITVKWPNDLLWQHRKLCGILVELQKPNRQNATDLQKLIIGIGLNVNTATAFTPLSDKPSCSLFDITGQYSDRNTLIAQLIVSLDTYLERFLNYGFTHFKAEWAEVDYLFQQWISITQPTTHLSGQALGVNDQGLLRLQDSEQVIHFISAGEVAQL